MLFNLIDTLTRPVPYGFPATDDNTVTAGTIHKTGSKITKEFEKVVFVELKKDPTLYIETDKRKDLVIAIGPSRQLAFVDMGAGSGVGEVVKTMEHFQSGNVTIVAASGDSVFKDLIGTVEDEEEEEKIPVYFSDWTQLVMPTYGTTAYGIVTDTEDTKIRVSVLQVDGKIVSSCVCVIIPNLTRNIRPYAFVENVVTREDYRGKGYAGECLEFAREIAEKENCYKMMLLTGSKKPETIAFYEKAGYNSSDKTAFIQWLGMKK